MLAWSGAPKITINKPNREQELVQIEADNLFFAIPECVFFAIVLGLARSLTALALPPLQLPGPARPPRDRLRQHQDQGRPRRRRRARGPRSDGALLEDLRQVYQRRPGRLGLRAGAHVHRGRLPVVLGPEPPAPVPHLRLPAALGGRPAHARGAGAV